MTDSGYPRVTKLWERGKPLDTAKVVYEGESTDMSIAAMHDDSPALSGILLAATLPFTTTNCSFAKIAGR